MEVFKRMAIIKRALGLRRLETAAATVFVGSPGQTTVNSDTGKLFIHDGVTLGGFEVSDDNTLTIGEIRELLDDVYLSTTDIVSVWKILSDVKIKLSVSGGLLGSSLNQSATMSTLANELQGYIFPNNNKSNSWGSFKIGDDIEAGSGLNFFIDWVPTNNSSGSVIWGIEYVVGDPHNNNDVGSSSLFYITTTVPSNSKHKLFTTELPELDVILDPNLTTDSLVMVRYFRAGDSDSYNSDVMMLNTGIKYLGV